MVQSVPALVNWKPEGALEIGQHTSICSFKIQTKIKKQGDGRKHKRGVRGLGYKLTIIIIHNRHLIRNLRRGHIPTTRSGRSRHDMEIHINVDSRGCGNIGSQNPESGFRRCFLGGHLFGCGEELGGGHDAAAELCVAGAVGGVREDGGQRGEDGAGEGQGEEGEACHGGR
jgi:hypothetical protein